MMSPKMRPTAAAPLSVWAWDDWSSKLSIFSLPLSNSPFTIGVDHILLRPCQARPSWSEGDNLYEMEAYAVQGTCELTQNSK
jgi:hypothetical protein